MRSDILSIIALTLVVLIVAFAFAHGIITLSNVAMDDKVKSYIANATEDSGDYVILVQRCYTSVQDGSKFWYVVKYQDGDCDAYFVTYKNGTFSHYCVED